MNKVETEVRIIHVLTGLVLQFTEERSQFQNKQRAIEKLQVRKEQEATQVNAAWREHTRIIRENPVQNFDCEKFAVRKQQE